MNIESHSCAFLLSSGPPLPWNMASFREDDAAPPPTPPHPFDMDRLQVRTSFDSDGITAADSDVDIPLMEKATPSPSRIDTAAQLLDRSTRLITSINASTLKSLSKSVGRSLMPSFLGRRSASQSAKTDTNSIAALDGLRGLACLFVFNEHLSYNYTDTFLHGWGSDNRRTLIQLPFIRVMWSGFSMVSIFFVISGYVLSYKPLKQIRARETASFNKTLTSSVFRRALRLYLPTIIATMICGVLVSLGAFNRSKRVFYTERNFFGLHEGPPPIMDSFSAQMYDTTKTALQMLNFWDWTDDLSAGDYDRHYWTIVVEFRSSMVLFLLLLGTSRLRQAYRLLTCASFFLFCILYSRKEVLLFVSGMFIAELDLIRKSFSPASLLPNHHRQRPSSTALPDSSFFWVIIFTLGLFLCSAPVYGCEETFGFQTLTSLVPSCFPDQSAFLRAMGAILVTWPAANSDLVRPLFTNRVSLYLGKISFALYLVHGNVLKTVLFAAMPGIYGLTNGGTKENITITRVVVSWVMGAVLVLPVTFWAADLFWRGVDVPCVRFARWFESLVCEKEEEGEAGVRIRVHKVVA